MVYTASHSDKEKSDTGMYGERPTLTAHHLLLYLVCALGFMVDIGEIAISSAFGAIFSVPSSSGMAGNGLLSVLLSAPYVGATFGALGFGQLARRFSIRVSLAGAMALLTVTSLGATFSQDIEMLIVMRALSGLAIGAFPPLAIAFLADHTPGRWRAAVTLTVTAIGTLGAPLMIYATRHFTQNPVYGFEGWRVALFFGAMMSLAVSVGFSALRKSDNRAATRARIEPASPNPAGQGNSKMTTFLILPVLYAVVPWAGVGFPLLSGAILVNKGFNLNDTLLFVTAMSFGPAVGTVLSGFMVDRISRRSAVFLTLVGGAISLVLFGIGNQPWLLGVSSVLFGFSMGLFLAILSLYAAEFFSAEKRVIATTRLWAMNRVSVIFAPLVLLPLLHGAGPWTLLLTLALVLCCSAALTWLAPAGRAGEELA